MAMQNISESYTSEMEECGVGCECTVSQGCTGGVWCRTAMQNISESYTSELGVCSVGWQYTEYHN